MKYINIVFVLMILISCSNSIEKNSKLVNAICDTTISIRGNLIVIAENAYRLDYYDIDETDSHIDYLRKQGFQGGGYSWEGIVYGAIMLSDPNIMNLIQFDPEAEGLAIWSTDKATLEKIGRLIAVVKTDKQILKECITVAKKHLKME